ncbi:two-component sensor histidine kinase [Bradyrhizobium japonicum]|uniref:hypothetical protein n=1 Tax=Bradyrhizobium japonicum TaxID=375 RepID=UPI0033968B0F
MDRERRLRGRCSRDHRFGTKLVEITIERIGGEIERDWRPEGLSVRISLPLKSMRS